jgi:hypothetical protein
MYVGTTRLSDRREARGYFFFSHLLLLEINNQIRPLPGLRNIEVHLGIRALW